MSEQSGTTPWGTLGLINFEVTEAPRQFRYQEATEYAQHKRIEGKAMLQRVGEALQSLDLSFRFGYPWCQPDEQLERLQQARIEAEPLPLILGRGRFQGNYVIEDIQVDLQETTEDGLIILMEVSVQLLETQELPEPELLLTQAEPFETRA